MSSSKRMQYRRIVPITTARPLLNGRRGRLHRTGGMGEHMECVVCYREGGSDDEGVITLQSTEYGMVCPRCVGQMVGDIVRMRTPWTKEDLKAWGYGEEE